MGLAGFRRKKCQRFLNDARSNIDRLPNQNCPATGIAPPCSAEVKKRPKIGLNFCAISFRRHGSLGHSAIIIDVIIFVISPDRNFRFILLFQELLATGDSLWDSCRLTFRFKKPRARTHVNDLGHHGLQSPRRVDHEGN